MELIENIHDFSLIADEWNVLADRFKTPLLRHEWFESCARAFCPPGKLFVVINRSAGRIVAIAPLAVNRKFGMDTVELLGTSVLGEPSGFLYEDERSLSGLMQEIFLLGKSLHLKGLPSASPELCRLKDVETYPGRNFHVDSYATPWIPISTTWENYSSTISPRWRSAMRRAARRANEFGDVEYEIITPSSSNLDSNLAEAFKVEGLSWKARAGTALQSYKVLGDFFTSYALSATRLGMLRIAFLRINGEAVATQLFIEFGKRWWVLKIGYNESYARCSPGVLLMNEVIRRAFDRPLEAFELLGTNQAWMGIWPNNLREHEIYRFHPFMPAVFARHGLDLSRRAIDRVQTAIAKRQKSSELILPSLRGSPSFIPLED
jgi:CelD/BcsL family acetyltransferase involved in cellulose biosynthesis